MGGVNTQNTSIVTDYDLAAKMHNSQYRLRMDY